MTHLTDPFESQITQKSHDTPITLHTAPLFNQTPYYPHIMILIALNSILNLSIIASLFYMLSALLGTVAMEFDMVGFSWDVDIT